MQIRGKLVRQIANMAIWAAVPLPLLWAQGGPPPGGEPPGGNPPGGPSTSVTYYATYKLDGGTATQSGQTYSATAADTSGVWVANSGVLTLTNPTILTSGNTSSQDNSSFYGLNAGLLATSGSASVTGGTITTSGLGANGGFRHKLGRNGEFVERHYLGDRRWRARRHGIARRDAKPDECQY